MKINWKNKGQVRLDEKERQRVYYLNNLNKVRLRQKKYRLNNKSKEKERHKRYYDSNKFKLIKEHKSYFNSNKGKNWLQNYLIKNKSRIKKYKTKYHLKSKYGITLEERYNILKKQNYICPICLQKLNENESKSILKPVIDHCHKTKKIRGIIHNKCNIAIGLLKDNPLFCSNASIYLGGEK